uniref:Integration host factor subunit beta n=1 Tax=Candidatus Kentrum sp. FM TaxID=2126340 RepID=A0A450VYE7_9GAMM|nr:MAG: integration host factor subunit beta [Candidatus Kentron sp. FM]VFJ53310.1 MAG: integration host factor subunit beta [Candidatus Kentron sp. FM]VFK09792.1 MAG: integration host factor subunit beta [Candidatus Kentron sp. FM]
MNKPDLIEYMLASTAHYNHKDITQAVNVILSAIEDSLASGERTEIRGFGAFDLRYHPPHVGRNPNNFKPGKELRESVDRGKVKEAT